MAAAEELNLQNSNEYKAAVAAASTLPGDETTISTTQSALQAKVDEASQFDGTATVSVEKFVLGQGYIIEPTKVQIKNGESAKAVFKRLINQELGYGKYRFAGWSTWVADESMKAQDTDLKKEDIPDYIINKIGADNISTTANQAGMLGSFDFLQDAGFVATKNNASFTTSFDDETVNNGDVLRLGFSFAMGSDWINSEGQYAWEQTYANVDELQKTMVAAKEKNLQDSDEYKAAVAVSSTLPGNQTDVDKADADLKALINGSGSINVVVDVEKFTLGQGYLIEPTVVPAEKGETVEAVVKRFLDSKVGSDGYIFTDSQYGAYLSGIIDASMSATSSDLDPSAIPSYITDKAGQPATTNAKNAGWLHDKEFYETSGYTYCVNDKDPGTGMSSYTVQDNDVIRIGYSIQGMGADWYKTDWEPWDQKYADKSMATAAIADAAKYVVTGDEVTALKAEAAKLPGDQTDVNNATEAVEAKISEIMPGKVLGNAKGQGYNYKTEPEANTVYGKTGESKKLTGLKFEVGDNDKLGISYQAHVANVGWMDPVADGAEAGKGNNAIEAVKINLTGEDADKYDVFYRAHVAYIGWMQWTKNGEMAGTQGFAYPVEAVEAFIAPKGYTFDHNECAYDNPSQLPEAGSGRGHIQNIGDGQGFVSFNQRKTALIGTTGRSLRMEGITLKDEDPDLTLKYRAHCQAKGWTDWVNEGEYAGTQGRGWRMEALEIKTEGDNADKYEIEYRAHVQNIGWMPWVKSNDGQIAGTVGQSLRVEAIEIRVVEK